MLGEKQLGSPHTVWSRLWAFNASIERLTLKASSHLPSSLGIKDHGAPRRHHRRPYLPHELLLAHSNPLSLHLDPLKPKLLLLLLLSGQRIGHAHEPCRWILSWVVLLAQGSGGHLLLVLVIHHCEREHTGSYWTGPITPYQKKTIRMLCALEYRFPRFLPRYFLVNQ